MRTESACPLPPSQELKLERYKRRHWSARRLSALLFPFHQSVCSCSLPLVSCSLPLVSCSLPLVSCRLPLTPTTNSLVTFLSSLTIIPSSYHPVLPFQGLYHNIPSPLSHQTTPYYHHPHTTTRQLAVYLYHHGTVRSSASLLLRNHSPHRLLYQVLSQQRQPVLHYAADHLRLLSSRSPGIRGKLIKPLLGTFSKIKLLRWLGNLWRIRPDEFQSEEWSRCA